jgi:CRP-like cAMP-binding protein
LEQRLNLSFVKSVLGPLPEALVERLASQVQTVNLKRGDYLYRAGESANGIYIVEQGLLGLTYISAEGSEHLLRLYRPGLIVGHRAFFAEEKYHASSQALEASVVYSLPESCMTQALSENPLLSRQFLKKLAIELREAELKLISRSEKDVFQRVAEALVYLKRNHPQHIWTRREISEFCGSTTATVIKAMAKLEQTGAISQDGRNFTILNEQRLLGAEV